MHCWSSIYNHQDLKSPPLYKCENTKQKPKPTPAKLSRPKLELRFPFLFHLPSKTINNKKKLVCRNLLVLQNTQCLRPAGVGFCYHHSCPHLYQQGLKLQFFLLASTFLDSLPFSWQNWAHQIQFRNTWIKEERKNSTLQKSLLHTQKYITGPDEQCQKEWLPLQRSYLLALQINQDFHYLFQRLIWRLLLSLEDSSSQHFWFVQDVCTQQWPRNATAQF